MTKLSLVGAAAVVPLALLCALPGSEGSDRARITITPQPGTESLQLEVHLPTVPSDPVGLLFPPNMDFELLSASSGPDRPLEWSDYSAEQGSLDLHFEAEGPFSQLTYRAKSIVHYLHNPFHEEHIGWIGTTGLAVQLHRLLPFGLGQVGLWELGFQIPPTWAVSCLGLARTAEGQGELDALTLIAGEKTQGMACTQGHRFLCGCFASGEEAAALHRIDRALRRMAPSGWMPEPVVILPDTGDDRPINLHHAHGIHYLRNGFDREADWARYIEDSVRAWLPEGTDDPVLLGLPRYLADRLAVDVGLHEVDWSTRLESQWWHSEQSEPKERLPQGSPAATVHALVCGIQAHAFVQQHGMDALLQRLHSAREGDPLEALNPKLLDPIRSRWTLELAESKAPLESTSGVRQVLMALIPGLAGFTGDCDCSQPSGGLARAIGQVDETGPYHLRLACGGISPLRLEQSWGSSVMQEECFRRVFLPQLVQANLDAIVLAASDLGRNLSTTPGWPVERILSSALQDDGDWLPSTTLKVLGITVGIVGATELLDPMDELRGCRRDVGSIDLGNPLPRLVAQARRLRQEGCELVLVAGDLSPMSIRRLCEEDDLVDVVYATSAERNREGWLDQTFVVTIQYQPRALSRLSLEPAPGPPITDVEHEFRRLSESVYPAIEVDEIHNRLCPFQ